MGQSEDADIQASIEAVGLSIASGDTVSLTNNPAYTAPT